MFGYRFFYDYGDGTNVECLSCPDCNGTGYVLVPVYGYGNSTAVYHHIETCERCEGMGYIKTKRVVRIES